jgi:shikimate 5-dehydrogenase
MEELQPATCPTMHFIGVTTAQSSIIPIFPVWAKELGINGLLNGIDFRPDSDPNSYRTAVAKIKADPLSLGALVTTHKINLFRASRDLFDELDPNAQDLHEVSCLSKRNGRLIGHAMDPITVGQALRALVPNGHWTSNPGQVLILGSGGSSLALSLHLHQRAMTGDGPSRVIISGVDEASLAEIRAIHNRIGFTIPITYSLTNSTEETDALIDNLPRNSLIVNATGLGKDRPGSPSTDKVLFPKNAIIWDFNYRGELNFLKQARTQENAQNLLISDGWLYFIISWTKVIGEVFSIDIPNSGPSFDKLYQIANELRV